MNKENSKLLGMLALKADPRDPTLHRKLKRAYLKLSSQNQYSLFKLLKEHPPSNQMAANVFRLMLEQAVVRTASKRKRPLHGAKKAKR